MEEKSYNLQSQQQKPVRVVSQESFRIKPPWLYDSSTLSVFKFQFETVNSKNGWDNEEKALELIVALKRVAVEKLGTMQASHSQIQWLSGDFTA